MIQDLTQWVNFEGAKSLLANFIADPSIEAIIKEEPQFGQKEDCIKCNLHLVDIIPQSSIKIEVFSNEEGIPHFRVQVAEHSGNYSIKDCTKINWDLPRSYEKKVIVWYRAGNNRKFLIEKWNSVRPIGCQVWEFKE
jgi:hypothetical protein